MQKVYENILGRTFKAEVYDFYENSPTTPYSTTKTTFNGRDQATLVRQYAGSDTSSTYQDTTYTYEGHGRVSTLHKPEWFDGTASEPRMTTWPSFSMRRYTVSERLLVEPVIIMTLIFKTSLTLKLECPPKT